MLTLKTAIDLVGGPKAASEVCGISVRGVYKWLSSGTLPRTEYTGETHYSELLAVASDHKFSSRQLLEDTRPNLKTA